MRILAFLVVFSVFFYSCTSTHMIQYDQANYDELNEKFKGKEFSLFLTNGSYFTGQNIYIEKNFASWIADTTKLFAPASEIEKLWVSSKAQGALGGLGYGFLTGAFLGTIFGVYLLTHMDSPGSEDYDIPAIAGISVLVAGVGGAIIGIPVGIITGGKQEYIFYTAEDDSINVNVRSEEIRK